MPDAIPALEMPEVGVTSSSGTTDVAAPETPAMSDASATSDASVVLGTAEAETSPVLPPAASAVDPEALHAVKADEASDIPEAPGVAEPSADYSDYPEAFAASNPPLVSQPEPPTAAVQAPELIEGERGEVKAVTEPSVENDDTGVVSLMPDEPAVDSMAAASVPEVQGDDSWHMILPQLQLGGMAQQLAEHCLLQAPLEQQADGTINLLLDQSGETLRTTRTAEALTAALQAYTSSSAQVGFVVAAVIGETPEKRRIRRQKERQADAERSIADDPVVQQLQQKWGGVVIPGSVRPNRDVDAA